MVFPKVINDDRFIGHETEYYLSVLLPIFSIRGCGEVMCELLEKLFL